MLLSAGTSALVYSVDNKNLSGGKFWAGFGATVAVNAAVAGISGGLGSYVLSETRVASMARCATRLASKMQLGAETAPKIMTFAAQLAVKGVISGVASMSDQIATNEIDQHILGQSTGAFNGVGKAFGEGFGSAVASGVGKSLFTYAKPKLFPIEQFENVHDGQGGFAKFFSKDYHP